MQHRGCVDAVEYSVWEPAYLASDRFTFTYHCILFTQNLLRAAIRNVQYRTYVALYSCSQWEVSTIKQYTL